MKQQSKNKKIISLILFSSAMVVIPAISILSCENNSLQKIANETYKKIYKSLQSNDKYGLDDKYALSVYDVDSFGSYTQNNPIKSEINTNLFSFYIDDLDYSQASQGKLSFRLNLLDKKTNKNILYTGKKDKDYVSQVLTISGFKKIDITLFDQVKEAYEDLNNKENEFKLSEYGIDYLNKNKGNLSNLRIDQLDKIVEKPINFKHSNKFEIHSIFSNKLGKKIAEEQKRKVDDKYVPISATLSFWVLLAERNTKIPMAIEIGIVKSNNRIKNLVKEIRLNYD